jgi:hypothetical protein
MFTVSMRLLQVSPVEQVIQLPSDAKILKIEVGAGSDHGGKTFLGVHYQTFGSAFFVNRYFWTVNNNQNVDDEKYGPFSYLATVTTLRGLVHVFERHINP